VPGLRGGGGGGARCDRDVEVAGLTGVQEGDGGEAEGVPGAGPRQLRRGGGIHGRQDVRRRPDGDCAGRDHGRRQGVPRLRADTHRERGGHHLVPSLAEGSGAGPLGGSAGGRGRGQGTALRGAGGVPRPGAYPALPVARAGERDVVPAEEGAEAVAKTAPAGLRAAHLRRGETGA